MGASKADISYNNWAEMIRSFIKGHFNYDVADHVNDAMPYYDVPTTLHVKDIEVKRYQPRPTDIIVDGVFNESSK